MIKTEALPAEQTSQNVEMEEAPAILKKEEKEIEIQPSSDSLIQKFTQLWFACYFERKLTRQKVCETDLNRIITDMISYFCRVDGTRVDFRRATPLLAGLHNLFIRRLAFLIRDSETTLKEMTEPAVKVEG